LWTVAADGRFDAVAIQSHPEIERNQYVHHAALVGHCRWRRRGVLGEGGAGAKHGLKPTCTEFRAFTNIGSEPAMMLTRSVTVTEKHVQNVSVMKEIGHRSVSEFERGVFAFRGARTSQAFDIDNAKINVNGAAIALGLARRDRCD